MSECVYDFMNCGRRMSVSIWLSLTFFDVSFHFYCSSIARVRIMLNFFGWISFSFSERWRAHTHTHSHYVQLNNNVDATVIMPLSILFHVKYLTVDFRRGELHSNPLEHCVQKQQQYNTKRNEKEFLKCRIYWLNYWWLHFQLCIVCAHNKDEQQQQKCMEKRDTYENVNRCHRPNINMFE